MSAPTSSRISDYGSYSRRSDDRPNGDDDLDQWSSDEWWREQNPGASVMRGLLYALPVAALIWLVMAAMVWAVFAG